MERSWGVLGEGRDLIITVGTMVRGSIRRTTISSYVKVKQSRYSPGETQRVPGS